MAASQVSICNGARARIGAPPILSLSEDTKRARACNIAWQPSLDGLLAEHAWPFALTRASLARLADPPAFGFSYAFQLPPDFISIPDEQEASYQIEGTQYLTDAESVRLRYVRRVDDPNLFPPSFVELLAIKLASELALTVTRKASDYEGMITLYRARLEEVKAIVSKNQGVTQERAAYWTEGRG